MKFVSLVVVAACAGELDDPDRFVECAPGAVERLFEARCGGACHAGNEPVAGLDLVSPGVAARVLGQVSASDVCGGAAIVDPAGGPQMLLGKLGDAPSCGARMPFGAAPLAAADVECVRRWIDDAVAGGP